MFREHLTNGRNATISLICTAGAPGAVRQLAASDAADLFRERGADDPSLRTLLLDSHRGEAATRQGRSWWKQQSWSVEIRSLLFHTPALLAETSLNPIGYVGPIERKTPAIRTPR
jgi:hypothetical protein